MDFVRSHLLWMHLLSVEYICHHFWVGATANPPKSVKNCKRNLWKLPKVNRFWFFQRLLAKLSEEPKKLETFKKDRSTLHFPIIKGLLKIESVKVQHCARVERKLWSAFNCLRMGQRKPNVKRPSNFIKFRMTLNVLTLSCGHNKYTLFLVLGINV